MVKEQRTGLAGHRRRVLAAISCAAGIGAALAALLSSADALFLSRVGARHLGTGFAVSSAVSMFVLWGIGALADRHDRSRLLWLTCWGAIAIVVATALVIPIAPRLSAAFLLVAGKQIGGSLELLLWVVIADRFTTREARRLLPWMIVGHGGGAAAGALSVGPLAETVGVVGPVWSAAVFLLVASAGARLLLWAPDGRVAQPRKSRQQASLLSGFRVLKTRPLARWLALLVGVAGVFAPMMYYLLGISAAAEYTSEVELAGFLGNYRAYVQAAALVAQLAVAPWLSARLGVGLMMLLAPLAAVGVSLWVGLKGQLIVVLVAQASTRIFDSAIQNPAEQLIQNLLPREIRGRVAGVVGGVAKRSGAVLGGLAASSLIIWPSAFSAALVGAALAWLLVAALLWRQFAELAVTELSSTQDVKSRAADTAWGLVGERGLQHVRKRLRSDSAREQEIAITLLARLSELGRVDAVAELLSAQEQSPCHALTLDAALQHMLGDGVVPGPAAAESASALLQGGQAEREIACMVLGCAVPDARWQSALSALVAADSQWLVAAVALARQEQRSILETLIDIGAGHGAGVVCELRCEIARALAGRSADAPEDLAERLLRSLSRECAADLQAAALHSVIAGVDARPGNAIAILLRPRLLELGQRWQKSKHAPLREAALVALTTGGSDDLQVLVAALGDKDEAVRERAEELLRAAGDVALEVLSIASQSGQRRVRLAAVDMLADLRPSREALDALIERELAEMTSCSLHAEALRELDGSQLVRRRLGERIEEATQAALLALEARSSQASIGDLARRLARAASTRSRSRALEALDALLPRRMARTMLGALEGNLAGELSTEVAIEAEIAGRDRLTRDLIVLALGSEGRASYRESISSAASAAASALDPLAMVERLVGAGRDIVAEDVPSLLETIVALSELPLFAELSTAQLEQLAASVQWRSIAKGETLMAEGEDAHCMFFVRTGQLEVIVAGERVAEIGTGEPVGELALFSEDRRTATVVALEPGQLGILTREELENLIEEVPGIGLGLCQAMSRKLVERNEPIKR